MVHRYGGQLSTMKRLHTLTAAFISAVILAVGAQASAQVLPALPENPPVAADNPMTPEKIELGKQLFFDPRLSSTGTISCNNCHNIMAGGGDGRPTSVGVDGRAGGRKAPTVWNSAFMSAQFWDGRAPSLEAQVKEQILNPVEMGMQSEAQVVERIKSIPGYKQQFDEVFGGVSYENIANAIAAYERTLITPNSPFDRFIKGDDNAMSEQARRGMTLVEEVGCVTCHQGVIFAGPSLPMGQGFFQKFPTFTDNEYVEKYDLMADKGRFGVTGEEADKHMFKVQTWRNVALTAPYFHNGSVWTLDEAVRVMAKTQLNQNLSDAQVADIVSFLESLTGEFPVQSLPVLPPTAGSSAVRDTVEASYKQ